MTQVLRAITAAMRNTQLTLPLLLVLTCAVWASPGRVGHDPWKPDEAYTFGLVYHMVQTGDWTVPMLGGEPFVEKPPIYFIAAAWFASAFAGWMPLHDGARMATVFFMAITGLFTALTARALNNRSRGLLSVLVLLGSIGLVPKAHQLITDMALLCGFAMGFYGFAIGRERPWAGGFFLGTGVGLGFMSKGLLGPGTLGLLAIVLPLVSRQWRQRNYFLCLVVSVFVMLPWLTIWPWLLYQQSQDLFDEWFFVQNWGRFHGSARLGFPNERGFYLKIMPWYGWPAWPMAAWAMWRRGRDVWALPRLQLPAISFAVVLLVLSLAGEGREVYGLPLLLPLALLAVAGADGLRLAAVRTLDRFGLVVLTILAGAMWLGWLCLVLKWPSDWAAWISNRLHYQSTLPFMPPGFAMAVAASLVCVATIIAARHDERRPIINWTTGVALLWALAMTLWLPIFDQQKSYRQMMTSMYTALPDDFDCLASSSLGEPQRAMLDYYFGLVTWRLENGEGGDCRLLLVQGDTRGFHINTSPYTKLWEGARPADSSERYWLYDRGD